MQSDSRNYIYICYRSNISFLQCDSDYISVHRTGWWNSGRNHLCRVCTFRILVQENKILKGILAIICMCTFIMIFSSAYRMWMYVDVYHLTFLRMFVLWFLGTLTLVMLGTILSIYKKKFPLFRYIMLVVGCCYIVFSLARPDYWIATYNIANTENMNMGELNYLVYSLSDDAAPAIAKIQPQEITWSENDYWYYDDLEQPKNVLKNYFSDIKERYRNLDIRKWNYAKMQAVKEAEQYLTDK